MSPTTSTYLLSQENETNNGGLCLVGLPNGGVTYKLIFCSWDQMTHRHEGTTLLPAGTGTRGGSAD